MNKRGRWSPLRVSEMRDGLMIDAGFGTMATVVLVAAVVVFVLGIMVGIGMRP